MIPEVQPSGYKFFLIKISLSSIVFSKKLPMPVILKVVELSLTFIFMSQNAKLPFSYLLSIVSSSLQRKFLVAHLINIGITGMKWKFNISF